MKSSPKVAKELVDPVQKAQAYLAQGLDTGIWHKGGQLPHMQQLAAAAQVRVCAMSTAVAQLKERGLLSVIKGHGIFVPAERQYSKALAGPQMKWQKLRTRIEQDILSGHFPDAKLPGLAQLQHVYGACYTTLRKCMDALVADHVITDHGRGFRVRRIQAEHKLSAILFIGVDDGYGNVVMLNNRFNRCLELFENFCIRGGLKFLVFAWPADDPAKGNRAAALQRLLGQHLILGVVVWRQGIHTPGEVALLSILARHAYPVALFDEMGDALPDSELVHSDRCRIFTIEASGAGLKVANCLLSLGHRAAAYVYIAEASSWAPQRKQGLAAGFEHAGLLSNVIGFPISPSDPQPSGQTPDRDVQAYRRLHKMYDQYIEHERNPLENRILLYNRGTIEALINFRKIRRDLKPVIAAICENPAITAVVASNDTLAIFVLEGLREQGKSVPQDVSVVGFDNSEDSHQYLLSSYDFNFEGLAHQAMGFFANPSSRLFGGVVRVYASGFVVPRTTTGPVAVKILSTK